MCIVISVVLINKVGNTDKQRFKYQFKEGGIPHYYQR